MRRYAALLSVLALCSACRQGCRRPTAVSEAATSASTPAKPVTLEAYVPCGMTAPFHDAFEAYQAANPAATVMATYDNDALLFRLVRDQGKRPDIFISPGGSELDVLALKGLVDTGLSVRIGSLKIVSVARRDWPVKVAEPDDLLEAIGQEVGPAAGKASTGR